MKAVRFRREAADDLRAIKVHYLALDRRVLNKVLDDIERAIDLVRRYPFAGQAVVGHSFRRIVTRRYGFKIAYVVVDDVIDVLGLFRFQNRES